MQVKQSEHVGRKTVDEFEAAIERSGNTKGYIVAFSFTRNAREEVARVRADRGLEMELVEVATLVKAPPDETTPNYWSCFQRSPRTSSGFLCRRPDQKALGPHWRSLYVAIKPPGSRRLKTNSTAARLLRAGGSRADRNRREQHLPTGLVPRDGRPAFGPGRIAFAP